MRGAGDARAAELYAEAYSADADFFRLYRSLLAYRTSFERNDGSMLVLQPNSDFFRYFREASPEPRTVVVQNAPRPTANDSTSVALTADNEEAVLESTPAVVQREVSAPILPPSP